MASTSTRILCLMRTDSAFPRSAEWRTVPFIKTPSCSIVFCVYCLSSALFRWPNKCLPSFDNCQHLSSIDNFLQTRHEIVPRLAQPFVIKNKTDLNFFGLKLLTFLIYLIISFSGFNENPTTIVTNYIREFLLQFENNFKEKI